MSRNAEKKPESEEPRQVAVAVEEGSSHLKAAARRTYMDQKQLPIDDSRIVQLLPMVHKIAQKVITYLRPPLALDDLISAGMVGLVKAARDYDPSFQAEFKTYAYTRIKGAILDELRNSYPLPADLHQQLRQAMNISQQIYAQSGNLPTDEELADRLGVPIEKLYDAFQAARTQHFLSIDGFEESDPLLGEILASVGTLRPDEQLERAELIEKLSDAITSLAEKQRQVVILYYQQQLTMKQIADVLEISEPRVSQIHSAALFNLAVKLETNK
jgi:RNA polymerase sigma factor for flagellar operon FliA